jgi:hypothetical protein
LVCISILALLIGVSPPARHQSPADQFQAIYKEFNTEGFALRQATTDAEREATVARVDMLTQRLMELAEKNPRTPVAMDALVQAAVHEMWMENNTTHMGRGQDSPEVMAIAILVRDHAMSDQASEACRRMSYGFRDECETYIRKVMEVNPSRTERGMASIRLAQFVNRRLQRIDLLKDQPDMARRYRRLFGKEYLEGLRRKDRAKTVHEIEALFERAARDYGDVKLTYGGTVGETAASELYEIRSLSVGMPAHEIEGDDQDGARFKLSDYRGKVVLLYFWSEY